MRAASCLTTVLSLLLLSCTASFAFPPAPSAVSTLEGLVVGIAEGDQLTVNSYGTEIRVRLYGIASPQPAKIDKLTGWSKPGQPFAEEAYRALSIKVLHQQVKVEIRQTLVFKTDPRQVAVGVVYLDGRNINLEMVAEGWAWAFRRLASRVDFPDYAGAERRARVRRSGLWSQDNPQPPWEFKPKLIINPRRSG